MKIPGFENGEVLANHSHVTFIAVSKRPAILASSDSVGNDVPDESSLLNSCLRHSGNGVTILGHSGHISGDKDV